MAVIKKTLLFGEKKENPGFYSTRIFITDENVCIADSDETDPYFFVEISFQDWRKITKFINNEIKENV